MPTSLTQKRHPGTELTAYRRHTPQESVDNTTRLTKRDCFAAIIGYASRGTPASGLMFLFGNPLDPERAGMMANTLASLITVFLLAHVEKTQELLI